MKLPAGVRRFFRLRTVERDVDDEIRHHFDEFVRTAMGRGLSQHDAMEEARARFGDEVAYRRALVSIDRRASRRPELLDTLTRTFGLILRRLHRAPGFTTAIVAILGLGLGANAVMFSVVDRLLLSPPQHVVDADDVRRIQVRQRTPSGGVTIGRTLTWPDIVDMEGVGAFASVAGFTEPQNAIVGRAPAASQARVSGANADFFDLLGVRPRLGRFFSPDEDRIDAPLVAVVSSEYWERALAGDSSAVGSTLDVDLGTYRVVGVAPSGFTGATLAPVDIWLPLLAWKAVEDGSEWQGSRRSYWVHAVARLAEGASVEAAEAEATAAHRAGRAVQIAEDRYDEGAEVLAGSLIEGRGPRPSSEARIAGWLAGVSLIVLLIACLNVANLLLAHSIRSRRETAIRLTLGVGRARLMGEVLAQSLVLTGLGALAAVVFARTASALVHESLLPNVAFTDTGLTGRLLAFTLVAAVVAAVVTAVVPALQARGAHLAGALRDGGRSVSTGRSRTRLLLLVGQATLSVVLLVGAGLFVKSLQNAQAQDLGFQADRIAVLRLEWNGSPDGDVRADIYEDVRERIRNVPGVREAALAHTVPFRSSQTLGQPRLPGRDAIPRHASGGPYVNKVGSGFFAAMGLEIVRGRGIERLDDRRDAPPVAVVNESMAAALWPDGDAVGSCMILGVEEQPCTEVIGVVENSHRQAMVERDPHFLYYVNQSHPAYRGPPQSIVVGAEDDPSALLPALRNAAQAASPEIRFVEAVAMRGLVEPEMRAWRLGASMFTIFGVLALLVAAWGLYSVLAFDIALRQHELGVRAALGAGAPRLVRMVLRQAVAVVGSGVALGLIVAGAAAHFVEPLLFRVSAVNPQIYSLVAGTLVLIAVLAGVLPAWRASRVQPTQALRAG